MRGRHQQTYHPGARVERTVIFQAACQVCGWEAPLGHTSETEAHADAAEHRCTLPYE